MGIFLETLRKWFKRLFGKSDLEAKVWRSITINDKVFEDIIDFPKQLRDYLKQVDAEPKSITMDVSTGNAAIVSDFGGVLISHENLVRIMKDYLDTKSILDQYSNEPYAKIMDDELHDVQDALTNYRR